MCFPYSVVLSYIYEIFREHSFHTVDFSIGNSTYISKRWADVFLKQIFFRDQNQIFLNYLFNWFFKLVWKHAILPIEQKLIENITWEHFCSILPVMRVGSPAAHQLQATSLLMHSFFFQVWEGKCLWCSDEFTCIVYFY